VSTSYDIGPDGDHLVREAANAGGLLPRGNQQYAETMVSLVILGLFTLDNTIRRCRLTAEGERYAAEQGWVVDR
jgi:hypothetical protein